MSMYKKTRRDFIKISALGLGGAAVASGTMKWAVGGPASAPSGGDGDLKEFKRFPTYCEVCFWKCAGWTHVDKEGKIRKIIGHDDDPHCNGRLCPRGTGGIGMY